jgi:hypothetical protein
MDFGILRGSGGLFSMDTRGQLQWNSLSVMKIKFHFQQPPKGEESHLRPFPHELLPYSSTHLTM